MNAVSRLGKTVYVDGTAAICKKESSAIRLETLLRESLTLVHLSANCDNLNMKGRRQVAAQAQKLMTT